MSDKLLTVLIILCLMVGLFSYDRYMIEKGEKSPIGQMIDSYGLSELPLWKKFVNGEEQLIAEDPVKGSYINSQKLLRKLRIKGDEIRKIRLEIISRRKSMLEQLISFNREIRVPFQISSPILLYPSTLR